MTQELTPAQLRKMKDWAALPPATIVMDRMDLLTLIGTVQLALRPPKLPERTADAARAWIGAVRAYIAAPGSLPDRIIEQGFNPAFDYDPDTETQEAETQGDKPQPPALDKQERFHAHLDCCSECADNPFSLCTMGHAILTGS